MERRNRVFTLDEALRLLPTVRQLIIELQEGQREIVRLEALFDELQQRTGGNGHIQHDISETRESAERKAIEMRKLYDELIDLGVELKGIDEGLLDFPSMREGRLVYLCWRLGEDTISYWHDLDTGFAGRMPL